MFIKKILDMRYAYIFEGKKIKQTLFNVEELQYDVSLIFLA